MGADDTPQSTANRQTVHSRCMKWHGYPAHAKHPEHRQVATYSSNRVGRSSRRGRSAYSLIEVLVAAAILVIGITGAALLANSLLLQEESNGFSLRAFNTQEQAARLWQLGLSPTTITNILPERCSTNASSPDAYTMYLGFTADTTNLGNGVTVEILNPLRIVFHSGFDKNNNLTYITNDIVVVRPSIR